MRQAKSADLDLVEVAPTAKPPVCKIVDYGKVLFDQRRRMKQQKKKQHRTVVKEVKIRLKIAKHDYETKLNNARRFLGQGDKVKFTILFRAREVTHQDIGRELSERILQDMSDMAELEGQVSRVGKIHTFLMSRRKDYRPPREATQTQADGAQPDHTPTGEPEETTPVTAAPAAVAPATAAATPVATPEPTPAPAAAAASPAPVDPPQGPSPDP